MPLSCLIIDDEPLALDLLEGYVRKTPFLHLAGRCTGAIQAMDILHRIKIDLVFLDIQMPDMTGMEFARMLTNGPLVIFTTAYERYALEGFKVEAVDYLLKPISYAEFLRAANKALKRSAAALPALSIESIFVKSGYKLIKIDLDRVVYIEGMKDYVKIFLERKETPVVSLLSLKSLEAQLPAGRFIRVHRSFIINTEKISSIESGHILLGPADVPLADSYKFSFYDHLKLNRPDTH
jgi:DNA-binding LytR/AlgR family response regulator